MDEKEPERQGTGLRDVFRILANLPQERLLSLLFQLGGTPAEDIIHALCLIFLQRGAEALNKLQALKDNYLANHLAEKWHISGGKLEDFGVKCGHVQEFTVETLAELARIFKVLSEQRLCDPPLRDLAYQRALSSDNHKTGDHKPLEYTCIDQLREEAKVVCGPKFAEWMCFSKELRSGSYRDPRRGLDTGNTALKPSLSQDRSESTHSPPSSLHVSSSIASYPTHLEISIPPTDTFEGDKITPETSDHPLPCSASALPLVKYEVKNAAAPSNSSKEPPLESNAERVSKTDTRSFATSAAERSKSDGHIAPNQPPNQTTVPTTEPKVAAPTAANMFPPQTNVPAEMHKGKGAEEEEEATFYSFVILHAPEDEDMAESMKEKLESIVVGEGATFSEEFAIPGKSTLKCVEDAINNSAYIILLLTRNFNTRLLEVETDSALISSINNIEKRDTVIPLLPQENRMPRDNMPIVLQTLVPLQENKAFDKRIKKALLPAKIEYQRSVWAEKQRVKEQVRRQQRLKLMNKRQEQFNREHRKAELLEQERRLMELKLSMSPHPVGDDGRVWCPPQSNIHIENAQYIMIGNDSQMTVDLGGADKDTFVYSQEK
ncbi:TIR domain-containing adapter molecule 1 [Centroberyx gerrardi]